MSKLILQTNITGMNVVVKDYVGIDFCAQGKKCEISITDIFRKMKIGSMERIILEKWCQDRLDRKNMVK